MLQMRAFTFMLLLGLTTLGLNGCASVPNLDALIDRPVSSKATPQVMGARGPLSTKQTKAILDRLGAGAGGDDILKRHLVIEEAAAGTPLVAGNGVRILRDGPDTFAVMFEAMKGARNHINLEYYTLEDVHSGGESLSDLLLAKRAQGVEVNIIYDSYGSGETPREFFDRLKTAGVKLTEFNPLNPLDAKAGYSINDRDHRKILIVDGKMAIVGGINLATYYQSRSPGSGEDDAEEDNPSIAGLPKHWRDTDLRIEGPALRDLQGLFLAHWHEQKGDRIDETHMFPLLSPAGGEVIHILGSTPDDPIPAYYAALLSAIRTAEKSIWLTAAYFVPTEDEMEDLIDAAKRGVDVRLMLPAVSDSERAMQVGQSHYSDLMEAGVKIFELQNHVLHSKTAVIDGVWVVIGSSNFDHRSVLFNDEVDAVVLGAKTGEAMEAMFRADEKMAKQIDIGAWRNRPLSQRIEEIYSRIWEKLL